MLKKTYIKSRKTWKVAFELPASECPQGVEIQTVCLAGDFNNWEHAANPMELHKDIYKITLELEPGHEYQFRYLVNDSVWCNDWHADDYVPNVFGTDNCVARLLYSDG
jgi:1,4-alpha-glucan branching enzyme